ncbi:hypothetical conserved protein [Candidatus Nitrosoglobus terrae]|uniref:Hypothetical conserved protein n=1 Tax=Candidatus Nitrosoglobus terrae TaxID=1630141 RepID=A0A1Q2SPR6_9GAMM|nr:hypothetical protein [Candidatus Nitrosoglobus terrae]BAW81128.1 hypothetical conserved protein [Candidatus Nitrosoglobus terrae]
MNLSLQTFIRFGCYFYFLVILVKTAWISDDAAITLRTVLNFTHGFGPTFNVDERVQAYTHPLWFLLLSLGTLIFKNVYVSTFVLSLLASIASVGLLLGKFTKNIPAAILMLLALTLSKAFIDFSTSGLENPLSHLLSITIILLAIRLEEAPEKNLTLFFLCCSLLYLNRADLILVILPLAMLVLIQNLKDKKRLMKSLLIAVIPIIAWTGFSLYYYGFMFPNTAYAKLGTGIPQSELFVQGFRYILHSLDRDPLTLFWIALGLLLGARGSAIHKALAAGIGLYIVYIISVGGDFMEGRFFTVPFFVASVMIAKALLNRLDKEYTAYMTVALLAFGIFSLQPNIFSGFDYSHVKIYNDGIADERGFYSQGYGLLAAPKSTFARPEWTIGDDRYQAEMICRSLGRESCTLQFSAKVKVRCGFLGFFSVHDGPGTHYIDTCALADPLLARLPAKYDPNWRIGHFHRELPAGYLESIKFNDNRIQDPKLRAYYEVIRTITRGSLNSRERIMQILKINFMPSSLLK